MLSCTNSRRCLFLPHLTYLLRALLRIRLHAVSVIWGVLQGRVIGPSPNSQPGGLRCCISTALSPGTCPAKLNLPGTAVPAGIGSRVTKARKPLHHFKVQHLGRCLFLFAVNSLKQLIEYEQAFILLPYSHYLLLSLLWGPISLKGKRT